MNLPKVEIRTIPAPQVDLGPVRPVDLCDTCCGVPVTAAYALSDRIVMLAVDADGNEQLIHGHEARWLACRLCELLIDARETERLIERAHSASNMPDPQDLLGRLNATVMRLVVGKTQVEKR